MNYVVIIYKYIRRFFLREKKKRGRSFDYFVRINNKLRQYLRKKKPSFLKHKNKIMQFLTMISYDLYFIFYR